MNISRYGAGAALLALLMPAAAQEAVRFPADAGVIDVTDPMWGAIPNDGQDDSAAIQRVFDLMTPSGKIIYFPAGRYDLATPVQLRKRDIGTQAEDATFEGWEAREDGERTYLAATRASADPEGAARITYRFDAIGGVRRFRLDHRVPGEGARRFAWRMNGGEWVTTGKAFGGNAAWRDRDIFSTVRLETGENVLEIAALDAGLEIDAISFDYGAAYVSNTIVQGAGRAGPNATTLYLMDGATEADGSPVARAAIGWEAGVEQFFRTAVRDLKIVVGRNNPEADGLAFHGNNQATVADVTIAARQGSGDVGLDLAHSAGIGPILVQRVSVRGFDVGIHSGWQNTMRNFDQVTLQRQRQYGWVNEAASNVIVRRLLSKNEVPAFWNMPTRLPGDGNGRVVLMDSNLVGFDGASTQTAISTYGQMYARNVRVSGYDLALANRTQDAFRAYRGQDGIDGAYIDEWWSQGAHAGDGGGLTRLWDDTPDATLRLAASGVPTIPFDPAERWDGPQNHLVTLPDGRVSGRPDDGIDDTPSIQAAIDSGASTVYLPNGVWTVDGDLVLRGEVSRFLGTEAEMTASTFRDERPRFVIGPDGPRLVKIERLANFGFTGTAPLFEHASDRNVIFESVSGLHYRPTVERPGRLFLRDTVGGAILFRNQFVFANQLNIEEDTTLPGAELDARVVNDGAKVSILGFKTEMPGVHVKTINGGRTDLVGQHQLNNFGSGTPQYVTEDAALSVVLNVKPYAEAGTTYGTVVETRDGETRTGAIRGVGYVAFSNDDLWRFKGEVILDDDAPEGVTYEGDWTETDAFPRGFIGSGFAYAPGAPTDGVTYDVPLPRDGKFAVFARWVGDWGGQGHSNHTSAARFEIEHAGGTTTVVGNQDATSDGWYPLGTYVFEGGTGTVRLRGDGTGTINTDGVRFKRVR